MRYELKQNLIDLKINCSIEESKVVNGNINSLIQVLNNLISNSIQAYSSLDKEKIIELNIYNREIDNNIYIEVKDYAGGIPDEIANKLFKEMVTTKGKNGTGLGLFISYTNIKTQFGGNLSFYTKKGEGTIFRVIIPNKA
jgi:signal transduction histidine kinase